MEIPKRITAILKTGLRIAAFFSPSPLNVFLHRMTGATIGKNVMIHPGVFIMANSVDIKDGAKIKFGVMIYVRKFMLGRKSSIGFFTLVKGESDLIVGDASIIGPKCMINCSRSVTLDYYSGIGPGSYLYTHGSGMPVTEGYRATFAPINIGSKVWVSMRSIIGPGVSIGNGTSVMPGSVITENIGKNRLFVGDPAKNSNIPALLTPIKHDNLDKFAYEMLKEYCNWSNDYKNRNILFIDGTLCVHNRKKNFIVKINDDNCDIALYTNIGVKRDGMFFNIPDLLTDTGCHPEKKKIEEFMRLYYGLIFL
jgi:acetyltransferase-like isoleucine patch superfamily enzyme